MAALDVSIAQSSDDGWGRYDGSETNTVNQDLLLICNSDPASRLLMGFRFICPIPAGSTVDAAALELWCYGTTNDDPKCDIVGVLEVDPPTWGAEQPIHQDSYTLTTAEVSWFTSLGIPSAQLVQTPDIAAVLQELIDQPGYAAGQAISLLFVPSDNPDNLDFRCHGFGHATSPAPRLFGTYTEPVPADPPVLTGAAVNAASLVLTYDEVLDEASVPAGVAFEVSVGGVAQAAPSAVDVSGSTVTLTLAAAVEFGDVVTLDYTPGANPIRSSDDAEPAAALVDQAVTNNTPEPEPEPEPDEGRSLRWSLQRIGRRLRAVPFWR